MSSRIYNKMIILVNFSGILLYILYVWRECESRASIVHYDNVTLTNCGLNVFSPTLSPTTTTPTPTTTTTTTTKPTSKSCFKWHKSAREDLSSLRNIENGVNAIKGQFPHTVLILFVNPGEQTHNDSCTGSIINEFWVITAAHCIEKKKLNNTRIYVGLTRWPNTTTPFIKAKQFFQHQTFNDVFQFGDIGLIKLESKIAINIVEVNGICLPSRDARFRGLETATVTGWGFLNDVSPHSQQRRLKTTRITLGRYDWGDSLIQDVFIRYGKICKGDSGGPLFQFVGLTGRAVLIGITQGGGPNDAEQKCGDIKVQQFIVVPHYIDWIIDTIRNN